MKALTLWNPWASLVVIGAKIYETRTWGTVYRGPLAIHASASQVRAIADEPEFFDVLRARRLYPWNLPRGAVIGVVDLVGCYEVQPPHQVAGVAVCHMERVFGDFRPGRFAWKLDRPRLLREPVPWRGTRGLWDWPAPANLEELLTDKTPAEFLPQEPPCPS